MCVCALVAGAGGGGQVTKVRSEPVCGFTTTQQPWRSAA